MNAPDLAAAVVHWLEYEALCNRARLFSEASLRTPVGEYLLSTWGSDLITEAPYPTALVPRRGRPRSVDFCLKRSGGARVWTEILEAKWITARRDFTQEIFDDIVRLEVVQREGQNEPFDRYLLVAGEVKSMTDQVFSRAGNVGDGSQRTKLFESILPRVPGKKLLVPVSPVPPPVVEHWREAARRCGLNKLPLSMGITLKGSYEPEPGKYGCWIWRITSSQNRRTKDFETAE